MARHMASRWRIWLLLLALLLALGLRAYRLDGQSLWADEGNSSALAGRPFAEISRDAALDIHPPLYYFLLRIWTQLAGATEVGLRSLSVCCGVALVGVVYALGRRLLGAAGAGAAALFAAIAPFQVYYAQEARMYIVMALLAVLTAYAGWRLVELDTRPAGTRAWLWPAVLYVAAAAAGLYTHYFFPVALLAVNLAYLIAWLHTRDAGRIWRRLVRWALLQLTVILLYLPWLPTGVERLMSWPAGAAGMAPLEWCAAAWNTLCLGPASGDAWLLTIPAGVVLLIGLWPWRGAAHRGAAHLGAAGYALPVLGFALPLIVMAAGGLLSEARLKFLLLSSPFMALILARGVVGMGRWGVGAGAARRRVARGFMALAVAGVVAPSAWALGHYYFDGAAGRDDYRGVVEYIDAVARPDDAIILNAPGQWDVFSYYYRGEWPVYRLPADRPPDRARLEASLAQIAASHSRLYVLYWALDESDPDRITESWLDAHAFKGVDAWNGNMRFVVYETMMAWEGKLLARDLDWHVGPALQLRAAAAPVEPVAAGDILPLSLTWRVLERPTTHLKVFTQVLDAGNHVVGQRDAEPGGVASGAMTWEAGDDLVDRHGVFIEPGTPPGDYRLIAGLYDPETGQRALVAETGQDYMDLGIVRVERPDTPPPLSAVRPVHRVLKAMGPLTLIGYDRHELGRPRDVDAPLPPGSVLHLTFFWQIAAPAEGDWAYQIWLGEHVLLDWAPVGGGYGVGQWEAGEIVRDQVDLFLPAEAQSGTYRLRLDVREPAGNRAQWTQSLGSIPIR
jgi:mannosyltransferase